MWTQMIEPLTNAVRNMMSRRIYAISDLHVDYKVNQEFVEGWSDMDFCDDVLIVAGDVTDKLSLLEATLRSFKKKFCRVFYVPGNHELWIRDKDTNTDSASKFTSILALCDKIDVEYKPAPITGESDSDSSVWIVPLFSWYAKPDQDPEDSIYRVPPPHIKEDVAFAEQVWMDNHLCCWSALPCGLTPSMHFAQMNEASLAKTYGGAPVISFSHFLPRWDLIPAADEDVSQVNKERSSLGLGEAVSAKSQGGTKGFNFSRYAGSRILEKQIRKLSSTIHVYGHQHRNRDRLIDGVRYVSHCLGNPHEQKEGWVWGLAQWRGPKQIWPPIS